MTVFHDDYPWAVQTGDSILLSRYDRGEPLSTIRTKYSGDTPTMFNREAKREGMKTTQTQENITESTFIH